MRQPVDPHSYRVPLLFTEHLPQKYHCAHILLGILFVCVNMLCVSFLEATTIFKGWGYQPALALGVGLNLGEQLENRIQEVNKYFHL